MDLYKEYLGKYAEELPSSSLYFPLSMKENINSKPVVRTILAIDEEKRVMTFAGNIPEGSFVRFMKGNLDKLVEAYYDAALKIAIKKSVNPQFVLMVSCVGRKIVLGNKVEEEIEVVKELLDKNTVIGGFYSYGEIAPMLENVSCELHNQTMIITIISEDYYMDISNLNRNLERQINTFLSDDIIENNSQLKDFINVVNQTYLNYEKDTELFEQSAKLNDIEFIEINDKIKKELDQKEVYQNQIIDSICSLSGIDIQLVNKKIWSF